MGLACGLASGLVYGMGRLLISAALLVCCVVLLYVWAEDEDRREDERWMKD